MADLASVLAAGGKPFYQGKPVSPWEDHLRYLKDEP